MDRERYVPDPDQLLHPGQGSTEYYNDANGAVHSRKTHDGHGNTYTHNEQLGPQERYGYQYYPGPPPTAAPGSRASTDQVAGPAPHPAPAEPLASGPAPSRVGPAGRSDQGTDGDGEGAAVALALLSVGIALPAVVGYVLRRRALARRANTDPGWAFIALEPAWLAWLWIWLIADDVEALTVWRAALLTIAPPLWLALRSRRRRAGLLG
ncbi:hypothetical protein ACPC54_36430 [Kitasatospora sp. NPDC094028]